EAAKALMRNNMPVLAYIGGKTAAVTSKDHNYPPGETVEKQLIVINNSRETLACDCAWSVNLPKGADGGAKRTIHTGNQERIPLRFNLPPNLPAGKYEITAAVRFGNGETQSDSFTFNVLSPPADLALNAKVALFDPKGETAKLLKALKVAFQTVDAKA